MTAFKAARICWLLLCLSNPKASCLSSSLTSTSFWSPNTGMPTMGTPNVRLSMTPCIPQWVTKSLVVGWARISTCGTQSTTSTFGGAESSVLDAPLSSITTLYGSICWKAVRKDEITSRGTCWVSKVMPKEKRIVPELLEELMKLEMCGGSGESFFLM